MVWSSAGFSDSALSNGPVKCGTSGGPQGIGSVSADFVRGSLRFNGVFSVSIFYCTVFPCPSHQRLLFSLVPTSSFLLCTNGFVFPSYRGTPFPIVPTLLPDSSLHAPPPGSIVPTSACCIVPAPLPCLKQRVFFRS